MIDIIFFFFPPVRLSLSGSSDINGNFGILDQLQSLQWVKDNIAAVSVFFIIVLIYFRIKSVGIERAMNDILVTIARYYLTKSLVLTCLYSIA
jgi:hypothetical protein